MAVLCSVLLLGCLVLLGHLGDHPRETTTHKAAFIPYGEYLPWEEAQLLWPRYGYAVVVDVETGLAFRTQRRGGTYHADVQPVTIIDSQIMKILYQGRWSWNRRAAVVITENGTRIAASMNGMPHGQGLISGNGFNGHFCIHFRDSKVHCSSRVDLAHQVMIWKAAGLIEKKLAQLPPQEIIRVFFAALDNRDHKLALGLVQEGSSEKAMTEVVNNIYSIQVDEILPGVNPSAYTVNVRIVYEDDLSKVAERRFAVGVERTSSGYRIKQIESSNN